MEDIRRITTPELVDELARSIDPLAFFHPVEEERNRRYVEVLRRIQVAINLYDHQRQGLRGTETEDQLEEILNRRH